MPKVLEGTWEEIEAYDVDLAGHNVRLIVDPQADAESTPPFSVQNKVRLEELLLQGLQRGLLPPMTADDWDEIRRQGGELAFSRRSSSA